MSHAQKTRRLSRLCIAAVATLFVVIAGATVAEADGASGTWTGRLELRGNYYWEQSTRVVAPSLNVKLDAPNGLTLNVHYLVDSITSASQAAGALVDVRFTEVRHDVGLGASYEWELAGDKQLRLSMTGRVSREPDYLSTGGGINAALSLNDRSTVLRMGLGFVHDEVRQNFRTGAGARPDAGGGMGPVFEESFNALVLSAGWEQVLSPVATFQLSYDFGYMNGFLANAYRRVSVAGVLVQEAHPETRWRQTLTGRFAYYIRPSRTAVHLIYRAYVDSWDIGALTPEVRVYQKLGELAMLRVRWRHYRQRRSFFYADPELYAAGDQYVTADPKMSAFHSHLLGFQFRLALDFLDGSKLDFLRNAVIDLNFEYIWNTNRFGNGVISEVGLRVPFG